MPSIPSTFVALVAVLSFTLSPFVSAARTSIPSTLLQKQISITSSCDTDPAYKNLGPAIGLAGDWAKRAQAAASKPIDPYFHDFFSQLPSGMPTRMAVAAKFGRMAKALATPDGAWTLQCGPATGEQVADCSERWAIGTSVEESRTWICPSFPQWDPSWDFSCGARGPTSMLMHENLLIKEQGVSEKDAFIYVYYAQAVALGSCNTGQMQPI